jgi:dolichyl-phosphate beta-glucosyltransferase
MVDRVNLVSIVIPCYNGADILRKQLPLFLNWISTTNQPAEILIIDDGSEQPDSTRQVALENHCHFLALPANQGKGAAVKTGILAAQGSIILFTDVDIPFQYQNILSFIQAIQQQQADLVVGDRSLPESTYFTKISILRKLGSDLFSFIISRLFTDGLDDTQCGLKAFRREVALDLFQQSRIKGFAFDVEILYLASIRKYRRLRLPVQLRSNESSSVRVIYHGLGMLADLFKISYLHRWKRKTA